MTRQEIDYNQLENKIIEEIKSISKKLCCISFCSDCLLLPRTPENYIRFNYISKQALQKWLDNNK